MAGPLDQLENRGANQDAVALFQPGLFYLLAIDEGAVRRAEVLDDDLRAAQGDLRVLSGNHVLDQHHVEIARPTDDYLPVHPQRIFAPLVLAGDEFERVRLAPGDCSGVHGCWPSTFKKMLALLFAGFRSETASQTLIASAFRPAE